MLFAARSTKGIKKLTKDERAAIQIDNGVMSAITGMMLSDGHIALRVLSINARFMFSLPSRKRTASCEAGQEIGAGKKEKREYFDHVLSLMKPFLYCRLYALF